ncbi:hypothetical protein LCGC14_2440710, partial [marine sediment metagenome]
DIHIQNSDGLDAEDASDGGDDFPLGPHAQDGDQQEDQGDGDLAEDGQDGQREDKDQQEDDDGDKAASGEGETGEGVQVSDEEKFQCTFEGCSFESKNERGLKIHATRAHGNGAPADPGPAKKTSGKKKTKGKAVDSGKLIIVAGDTCAIVDASKDFSDSMAAIGENGKPRIYKLGPEVVVRTVIQEV